MSEPVTIDAFRNAIAALPSDEPRYRDGIWYRTQQEHWLGWLYYYHTPGAYGRQPDPNRDARFAYNHIVCPDMLLYLMKAAQVDASLVAAAREAAARKAASPGATLQAQSGAIRKVVTWDIVYESLFGNKALASRNGESPTVRERSSTDSSSRNGLRGTIGRVLRRYQ